MKTILYAFLLSVCLLCGFKSFGQAVPELIYYKFDAPGTTVQNLASAPVGTNPAPISGVTIGGTGQFGTALVGNGGSSTANAVNTGWAPNLATGDWTISVWFNNIPSSTSVTYLFGVASTGFRCFSGGAAGAGGIRLTDGGITAFNVPGVFNGGPVTVTFVHSDAAGEIKTYVNGALAFTSPQPNVNLTATANLLVGGAFTGGLAVGMYLDEFRIYNRALSAAEITATWNQTLPFATSPNDIEVTAITSPNSSCGLSNAEIITMTLKNSGSAAQSNIPVSYTLNTGTPVTGTVAGPLAPGASVSYSFTTTANLASPGGYTLTATASLSGDTNPANNSLTKTITNSLFPGPPSFDFETAAGGLSAMQTLTNTQSTITEGAGASFGAGSAKGMVMAGVANASWVIPAGSANPWTMNPAYLAGAYFCFSPAGGSASDSLWLTFDLRQLYKTANANTNFRITVNGTAIGGNQAQAPNTYRPPFAGSGNWTRIKLDLTAYKNLPGIEIGLESSVSEAYNGGAGPANLVDNIMVVRRIVNSTRDEALQQSLSVYPNPAAGVFNLKLPDGKFFTLEVSDLTGKIIQTRNGISGESRLNLAGTAKGIYLLKVRSAAGVAVEKLVIE